MMRVLFVEDDPGAREALASGLLRHRDEWTTEFAAGGADAIRMIEAEEFDVIVTDMRAPQVDGRQVLERAIVAQPEAVRIILSGQSQPVQLIRGLPLAHQMLSKPCDPEELRSTVTRSSALRPLLDHQAIREALGAVEKLPAIPDLYVELSEALGRNDGMGSLDVVAGIIEREPSITARLLQMINSPLMGFRGRVDHVGEAVSRLGIAVVQAVVLHAGLFEAAPPEVAQRVGLRRLGSHSQLTAMIAARIGSSLGLDRATASSAGILHDFGKLVLGLSLPELVDTVRAEVDETGEETWVVERRLNGFTHADAGAYLLALWGLPIGLIQAVAHHHEPRRSPGTAPDLAAAIHVADHLAYEMEGGPAPALDEEYLQELGVSHRVPEWLDDMTRAFGVTV